jgi:oligosaccharide repeat unit polymerase
MILAFYSVVSIVFFYSIFLNKNFVFGFKESFATGLIFYIHIPIIIFYFYHDFMIFHYANFYGYNYNDILKIQYLTIILIIGFFLGYISIKKKIRILNINTNYSVHEVIFSMFIISLTFFFRIPNVNPITLLFLLCCILIFKSIPSNKKKIFLLMLATLLFMYLSVNFSNARRHVIVIFLITMFFVSLVSSSKKNFFLIFFILFVLGVFFVFLVTHLRSVALTGIETKFNLNPSLPGIISNYDFMSAFDNLVYILNLPDLLYGKSIFKIFFSFIPRDIWFSKPLDTNLLIVQLRQNPFVGGSSQSVTLLGEVFWNFGWIGTFFSFFLIGSISKNFDLTVNDKLNDSRLIILAAMVYLIFIFWRGSISTSLVAFLINMFFLFASLSFSKFIFKSAQKLK